MKVAYVGNFDSLAAAVMERLYKEEMDVFFLSEGPVSKKKVSYFKYKNYQLTNQKEEIVRIFQSIHPDVVIYAGNGYLNPKWAGEQRENLSVLAAVLEECVCTDVSLFVCLSSTEVYGKGVGKVVETSALFPQTKKGMWMLQEEDMTEMYHRQRGLNTVILRLEPVFSEEIQIGSKEFFGQLAAEVTSGSVVEIPEQQLQPVHVSDVADAIKRIIDWGKPEIYNVSSSEPIKVSELVRYICEAKEMEFPVSINKAEEEEKPYIDNTKIKKEQEWTDFWLLRDLIKEKRIVFREPEQKTERKKIGAARTKKGIRRTFETVLLFGIFCMCYLLSQNHSLFSQVDWLLIYVVVISLCYGVKQGAIGVILSSIVYLLSQKENILEMTNFYSYVESVLMIVEFVFFGIVVGYTADILREENRNRKQELKLLKESYEKLKEISDKNILIKNEYEKRVLEAKAGLPYLNSVMNRIHTLDTERIFMECLQVVAELMQTKTVAVYKVNRSNGYLRLIASLNARSAVEGNSWNLKKYPDLEKAIKENRVYEGDIWKGEPAIVLPISSSNGCEAAVFIKELPMEKLSLYSVNLLRTLLEMFSYSLERALQYESVSRKQKYLKDTSVLYAEEFEKAVKLAEEKKQREMADYCILKLCTKGDVVERYRKAANMFREMDVWGMDQKEGLYVLLENTSLQGGKIVMEKLETIGIGAEIMKSFSVGG